MYTIILVSGAMFCLYAMLFQAVVINTIDTKQILAHNKSAFLHLSLHHL